jgi:hypothetical protein
LVIEITAELTSRFQNLFTINHDKHVHVCVFYCCGCEIHGWNILTLAAQNILIYQTNNMIYLMSMQILSCKSLVSDQIFMQVNLRKFITMEMSVVVGHRPAIRKILMLMFIESHNCTEIV